MMPGARMIPRFFAALGIDYAQWLALTKVALKLDWRQTSLGGSRYRARRGSRAAIISQLIFYGIFGFFMAFVVWQGTDVFLVGLVLTSYVFFIVGTAVLIDHNSALTSATDYGVLAFQPVSSRTYFAAKLANVLVYTLAITTVAAFLPIVALFVVHGAAIGFAGVAAIYGISLATALGMLTGYAWMLQRIGADALKRALSYVQLVMSFAIYGGYFLMSKSVVSNLATAKVQKTPWLLLYPGAWFSSYLDLAAGTWSTFDVGLAITSLVLLGVLAAGLGGRLSLDYSARLAALAATPVKQKKSRAARSGGARLEWWHRSGEARAMAVLVRSQFRNDQRFRLTVLGVLPLTLVYVFMGVRDGTIVDPFVPPPAGHGAHFSLVTVAVLMFPSLLKISLSQSESFQAAWVFFASPTDRKRIIQSSKNALVTFFLLPYLAFVAALYVYFVHNVWHVLLHVLFLGLLSHLLLQLMVLLDPELPFSRPWQKSRNSGMLFGFMMVIFVAAALLQVFGPEMYQSVATIGVVLGVLVGTSIIVDLLTRARIAGQAHSLEFEG
ncbi:MAG TPA: hypothetical protein VFK13_09970 [Gemmatimonadaceae bacterium]|nr:hypothetical protein [Gemmatimonadaceae bacterium]